MTQKIQKVITEIEKTRARVAEGQERLRELERQRTELENTEIVALFRSLDVAPGDLPAFIAAMKESAVPQEAPAYAPPPATPSYTSSPLREEENDNEE